jgi:hypothetical protein
MALWGAHAAVSDSCLDAVITARIDYVPAIKNGEWSGLALCCTKIGMSPAPPTLSFSAGHRHPTSVKYIRIAEKLNGPQVLGCAGFPETAVS